MLSRWNVASGPVRVNTDASLASKPLSFAVTIWSVPRAMVTSPGVTPMAYGFTEAASRVGRRSAPRPLCRCAGPSMSSATVATATAVSAPPKRYNPRCSTRRPSSTRRASSSAVRTRRSRRASDAPVEGSASMALTTAWSSEGSCSSR